MHQRHFIIIETLLSLAGTATLRAQIAPMAAPLPNWGAPMYVSDYPLPAVNNYQSQMPFEAGDCSDAAYNGGLLFTFSIVDTGTIPSTPTVPSSLGSISTSAVVYDLTTNRMAATLWNGVTLADGTYCGFWSGFLDTGTTPTPADPTHVYEVRLLHNNVQYTWDGVVGDTSKTFGGPNDWDGTSSFPTGLTFMMHSVPGGSPTDWGVLASGYNEDSLPAFVFKNYDSSTQQGDQDTLWPLNIALVTGGEFEFATNDGNRVYFSVRGATNAVVAFSLSDTTPSLTGSLPRVVISNNPDGSQTFSRAPISTYGAPPWGIPYIFTDVSQNLPASVGNEAFFSNHDLGIVLQNSGIPSSVNLPPGVSPGAFDNGISVGPSTNGTLTVKDPSGSSVTIEILSNPITGIAVQQDSATPGNILAVAQGIERTHGCNSQPVGGNSITLWDKRSGDFLSALVLTNNATSKQPINPQKMVFDQLGNLWVIDGGVPALNCAYLGAPLFGNRNATGRDPIWTSFGNLWKISLGGNGSPGTVPIAVNMNMITALSAGTVTLSNPIDLAISPATGHLFIADGGINQQVFEIDVQTLDVISTTGVAGGFGQSLSSTALTCNATITNYSFWLDFLGVQPIASRPWISIDNENGLWIGDYSTSRILHYTNQGGSYLFAGMSLMNKFSYYVSVPRNAPSRIFAGPNGLLEYSVDYQTPDIAAGPTPLIGNTAFASIPTFNWLPCVLQAEWEDGGFPDVNIVLLNAESFAGGTFGFSGYHSYNTAVNGLHPLISFPKSGVVGIQNNPTVPFTGLPWIDARGNIFQINQTNQPCGGTPTANWTCGVITQFPLGKLSPSGFPQWSGKGTILAKASFSLLGGDPTPKVGFDGWDLTPSSNGIIPIYGGNGWDWHIPSLCEPLDSTCSPTSAPTYHLAGVAIGGTSTQWHAQLEANVEYPSLVNDVGTQQQSVPSPSTRVNNLGLYSTWVSYAGPVNLGYGAHSIDNFIFTGVNGNWQEFSCQFYQYTDDGMLVGQFGWRGNGVYQGNLSHSGSPTPIRGEAHAPGFCGNPLRFKIVSVNGDYYLYVSDEGSRAGVQRWHIWNTSSIGVLRAATPGPLSAQTTALGLQ